MKKAILLASVFALSSPLCALAQESDDNVTSLGEIIVTAQKREERLIETPQTVNVVSGEQLEAYNITRFDDIQKLVPGLDITRGSGREQAVSLRGVRFDPDSQTSSTVDVYLNEVLFDPTQALQAQFDIGSIQVLRGPQGTLRGGTGPSGAILVGTRAPDLNNVTGNLSASYTDRESTNVQAGVSFPIVEDKLAVRIAGLYDWGLVNEVRSVVSNERDRSRSYGARLSILFEPTDSLSFLLTHQQFRSKITSLRAVASAPDSPIGVGPYGQIEADDRLAITDGTNRFETRGKATILNATWDLDEHRLSYVGSYQDNDFNTIRDLDVGNGLLDFDIFGIPIGRQPIQLYQDLRISSKALSNELRFERTGDHFWLYRFGIYARDSKTPFTGLVDYTGANGACQTAPGLLAGFGLPCLVLGGGRPAETSDRGYFTTHTFNFTDRDTLDLGVRYSETEVDNPPNSQSFDAWTGSASYKHEFSDAFMAYVNYGRSFRPGGFDDTGAASHTGPGSIPQSYFRWEEEKSDAFELGAKGTLLDGRVSYAVAAFYQKFEGFINRVNGIACTGNPSSGVGPRPGTVYATGSGLNDTSTCGNGSVNLTYQGDAIAKGVEAEIRAQLTEAWSVQTNLSYADAHYDDAAIPCNDYNGDGQPDNIGQPAVQAGQYISLCRTDAAVSSIPKFQATVTSEYRFEVADGYDAFVRGLARYRGEREDPNTGISRDSTFRVDAYAGVKTPQGVELSVFARNLLDDTDDFVDTEAYSLFGAPTGYSVVDYDQRREVGVQLRYDF
jgi:iron complex outermembrane recepter protein